MNKVKFSDFAPHVTWYQEGSGVWESPLAGFERELRPLFSQIYPLKAVRLLQDSGYNPVIIGYYHEDTGALVSIKELFTELRSKQPRCTVAIELLPADGLETIKDFFRCEKEYKETGKLKGETPQEKTIAELKSFREYLLQTGWAALVLWLLESEFQVINIEHQNALEWILRGLKDPRFIDKEFSGIPWGDLHHFHTAIRRDTSGLSVLVRERPEIVCVGAYHALKYDFLLERGGERSYYFLNWECIEKYLDMETVFRMWKAAHELYLRAGW